MFEDMGIPNCMSGWLFYSCGQFSVMTVGAAIHRQILGRDIDFDLAFHVAISRIVQWCVHRRWGCCSLAALVLIAGLNYWRDPTFGMRRYLDMAAVAATVMRLSL